jgi:hypothetical protein
MNDVRVNEQFNIKVLEANFTDNLVDNLEWLLSQAKTSKFVVMWDLDVELAPLFKVMPKYVKDKLVRKVPFDYEGYHFFYAPELLFLVSKNNADGYGDVCKLYNLSQFYQGYENPGAEVAERIAEELEHAFHVIGIWPEKLTSPVAVFEQHYMKHMDFPKLLDIPEEIMKDADSAGAFAYAGAKRVWIENYQVGYWNKCFDYDLRSAYANQMKNLLDLRRGTWKRSDEYQAEATYGYCRCLVEIEERVKLHPVIFADVDGSKSTPTGQFMAFLNKAEIDFIREKEIGDVIIQDGYWWKCDKVYTPLKVVVERILQYKEHEVPMVRQLAKQMLNGMWGKMLAKATDGKGFGEFFNPFWAMEVSAAVRLKVADFIYRNKAWNNVIAVQVDGVLLDREIENIPACWKLSHAEEALVISASEIYIADKHPRSLTLDMIKEKVKTNPNKGYYDWTIKRPATLVQAHKMHDYSVLGGEYDSVTAIDLLSTTQTRKFAVYPRSGKELFERVYKSEPLHCGILDTPR